MNLFGKAKATPAASDTSSTVLKLRETLESLDKREKHIQNKIKGQLKEAKAKSQTKDKRGAMFALKRKKMYEGEVSKLNGARMTLESQIIALEGSNINMQTFNAMRSGAKAMADARGQLDVDRVDDVMDDIKEEMDIAEQIGDAIGRPADDLFDDDELMDELNALQGEEELENEEKLEAQLLAPPAIPVTRPVGVPEQPAAEHKGPAVYELPSVPTGVPEAKPVAVAEPEDEEAKALRELEASMAI